MKLFQMLVRVRLFCGKCGHTEDRSILYVEKNKDRRVVVGCRVCRDHIVVIVLFPVPEVRIITNCPGTKIDFDEFTIKDKTFFN